MSLVRYEPWGVLHKFHDEVNRLLDDTRFGRVAERDGSRIAERDGSNVVTSHWTPAVDIRELPEAFVLTADVPGIDPKDIEVTMEDSVLTIKGERVYEAEKEDDGYKRVERAQGTFYRRFNLPDTADASRIEAKGSNGVLEISIPKQEKLQPRRIPIAA